MARARRRPSRLRASASDGEPGAAAPRAIFSSYDVCELHTLCRSNVFSVQNFLLRRGRCFTTVHAVGYSSFFAQFYCCAPYVYTISREETVADFPLFVTKCTVLQRIGSARARAACCGTTKSHISTHQKGAFSCLGQREFYALRKLTVATYVCFYLDTYTSVRRQCVFTPDGV